MRLLQRIIWGAWVLLTAAPQALASDSGATALNYYVARQQSRPFQIEDNGHNQRGLVTDLLKTIAARLQQPLQFHTLPFRRYLQTLKQQDTGYWITYGAPQWSEPQSLRLGKESIISISHSLLYSAHRPELQVRSASDLCGHNILTLDGFYYPALDGVLDSDCVKHYQVHTHKAAFLFVERDIPPALFIEMTYRIRYNLAQEKFSPAHFRLTDLSAVIPPYDLYFSYSADVPQQLIDGIDAELKQMKARGELQAIIDRYQN
ncbi:MAG: hypothetical protein CMI02_18365 [Oceanospirillaceae bacterium]|nr:hypothetical protein [Oceanospirillaceae bacterium]|tara:strand:- start:7463 stop:8245 length:783 start_codon:yes stop_codon:yes gene_type:complete